MGSTRSAGGPLVRAGMADGAPTDQQEQERALPELIKFLTDRRAMLSKLSKQDADSYYGPAPTAPGATARTRSPADGVRPTADAGQPGSPQAPLVELSQIIDTTLLKAYLLTNSALVGPLVRLENQCNINESVNLLKQYKVV